MTSDEVIRLLIASIFEIFFFGAKFSNHFLNSALEKGIPVRDCWLGCDVLA